MDLLSVDVKMKIINQKVSLILVRPFIVRPAWVLSNRLKSRVRPSSGKYIAKRLAVSSVRRNTYSRLRTLKEVRGQTSGLTNRNHIRQNTRIRLHDKLKSNSY